MSRRNSLPSLPRMGGATLSVGGETVGSLAQFTPPQLPPAVDQSTAEGEGEPPVVVDSPLPGYLPGTLRDLVAPLLLPVILELAIAQAEPTGYIKRHLDVGIVPPEEGRILARLAAALDSSAARLADGKLVGDSKPRAIRWLLQQIGAAAE